MMTKILVADDESDLETLIKQRFRKQIREQQYQFVFAPNGKEALQQINEHPDVDIVLSDINMPEMDGLSLLAKLNTDSPLIKAVMVSAYGDIDNIRSAMNKGAFDFVTKPINFQDLELTIEKTIAHVTQIRETLTAIKENNILKMYVDENVLKFMGTRAYEESLTDNETIDASVAFIDICGFTAISEKQKPDAVVALLNTYFDLMAQEITAQNGIIDKFMGDCTMAVFKGAYHVDRAIDACLSIREKVNGLPEEYGFSPSISIGISSGEMVSGNIGSPTLRRLDFTVIGDVVNTAQRLQSIAVENQILISETCYESVKDSFLCSPMGSRSLKNKTKELLIYEVLQ